MADEQLAIAAEPAAEPTIVTEQQPETEAEVPETILDPGEVAEEETAEGEETAAEEPEFITLERNGKTYQIPKELEGELLMQSDYTKKTQSVAEQAKALEARQAEIAQQAEATEAELQDRALLLQAKAELEQYKKVDWDTFEAQDPLGAQQHWRKFQMLEKAAQETEAALTAKQAERAQKAERDLATRVEETVKFASEKIPGWTPAVTEKLVKFAMEQGVPEATIKANWSPVFYKLLHQAEIGAQAMKRQATAKPAPAPLAPLATVSGKSTPAAAKSLSEVAASGDMEAYAKLRAAGRVR